MTEPNYGYGRARPEPPGRPQQPTTRMPAAGADSDANRSRLPYVNAGRLWAGGLGTAIVVALVIIVGIMLVRGVLGIPVLAPEGAGAYGNVSTTTYAFIGAVTAIGATALLHILLLFMPRPYTFFYWICVLITAVAVLLPFTIIADLNPQIATAGINLIAGICLMSVLGSIGRSCIDQNR